MENSTAVRLVISFLHPDKFVVRRPLIKPLYTPPENVSKPLVFDVFKEYRNEALARNELMLIKHISHLAASRSLFIEGVDEALMLTLLAPFISENCIKIT